MLARDSASEEIGDFLEFVQREGAVRCIDFRRGASQDKISRFAEVAGWPLPHLYLGFLREFGADCARLFLGRDGSSAVDRLLVLYASPTRELPQSGVVICTPAIDAAVILHYADPQSPPAVAPWWEGEPEPEPMVAPSFTHHLYRCGWLMAHWADGTQLTVRREGCGSAATLLQEQGFERLWFSGDGTVCLTRGRATRVYLEQQADIVRAFIWSREPSRGMPIVESLERELGMRRLGR